MLQIPYGQSYFPTIRRERQVYVDKTSYLRRLEVAQRSFVVYLRPRRFGKSTLLSTLEHYYARNYAAEFKTFFGDLDIGGVLRGAFRGWSPRFASQSAFQIGALSGASATP